MSKDTTADHLRAELRNLADTLEEVLSSGSERSKTELDKLRTKASNVLRDTRERLGDSGERIAKTSREVADQADAYVREKPWTSVGIGAAVGVVLGILLTRR